MNKNFDLCKKLLKTTAGRKKGGVEKSQENVLFLPPRFCQFDVLANHMHRWNKSSPPDVRAHFQNRGRKPAQSQDAKQWRAATSRSTRAWSFIFLPAIFLLPGFVFRVFTMRPDISITPDKS
jgi:hypothetical protein